MKKILATVFVFLIFSLSIFAEVKKPNILFIFADDMSPRVLDEAPENRTLKIPNIDSLAEAGTRFTNTYLMGSWVGAVCVSSRTCLNTGYGVWTSKAAYQNKGAGLKEAAERGEMWAQLMRKAGYRTFLTGKWHVLADPKKVFDETAVVRDGMPKPTGPSTNRPIEGRPDLWSPSDPKFEGYFAGGKHWTEVNADCAVEYLEKTKDDARPFFIYVAFNAPHDPRQAPQKYQLMYPRAAMKLPPNFAPEYKFSKGIGVYDIRDELLAPYPRTPYAVQTHISEYYAIITHLDENIGRILKTLKQTGKAEDTIIIFAADNGLAMGEHGLMGKQTMFDCSMKVPLVISGGDFAKGAKIDEKIYLQDIMPTCLELAGAQVPPYVVYKSLLPLLKGTENKPHYDSIYIAYTDTQRAVVMGDFKLIFYPQLNKYLLFDLKCDPFEICDVSTLPQNANTLALLKEELLKSEKRYAVAK